MFMFWPRYSRFHISFPAFVLSWTHIGSFCVHSYVHAGSHLAFWMCVLFSFKCCRYYSIHLKHAWLYLLYIFIILFIGVKELTAISTSYIWKVLFLNWIWPQGWQWKCFTTFSSICFCFRLVPSTWGEPGWGVTETSWGQRGKFWSFRKHTP